MAAYTDLTDATSFVVQLTGVQGRGAIIQQKLNDSMGKLTTSKAIAGTTYPANTPIYRPYFVAAKILQQNRADVTLKSADGATFTNLEGMIQSLMDEQLRLDQSLNLEVPPGFAAVLDLEGGPVMSILVG